MKGLYLCIVLSSAVCSIISPCVCGLDEAGREGENQLVLSLLRKDQVHGSYTSPKLGCGIVFNATKDSLLLSTLSGERLLSAEEQVGPVRLVAIGDKEFVQHRESDGESETVQDYAIPKHHGSFLGNQNHEAFMSLIDKLKAIDSKQHSKVLKRSVRKTLSKCELNLLSDAAIAMGGQGITSRDYPSTLPLYMTASRVASRSLANAQNDPISDNDTNTYHVVHEREKRQSCRDECPPCPDQECMGMCGPGCTCWEWACGNCCHNRGCYYHDLCCRTRPNSLACLMPVKFNCDSVYVCRSHSSLLRRFRLRF